MTNRFDSTLIGISGRLSQSTQRYMIAKSSPPVANRQIRKDHISRKITKAVRARLSNTQVRFVIYAKKTAAPQATIVLNVVDRAAMCAHMP